MELVDYLESLPTGQIPSPAELAPAYKDKASGLIDTLLGLRWEQPKDGTERFWLVVGGSRRLRIGDPSVDVVQEATLGWAIFFDLEAEEWIQAPLNVWKIISSYIPMGYITESRDVHGVPKLIGFRYGDRIDPALADVFGVRILA